MAASLLQNQSRQIFAMDARVANSITREMTRSALVCSISAFLWWSLKIGTSAKTARPEEAKRERRVKMFAERTRNMFFWWQLRHSKMMPVRAYRTIAIANCSNILKKRKETAQSNWINPHPQRMDTDDILLSYFTVETAC